MINYTTLETYVQDTRGKKIHPLQLKLKDANHVITIHGCGTEAVRGNLEKIRLSTHKNLIDLKLYVGDHICRFVYPLRGKK